MHDDDTPCGEGARPPAHLDTDFITIHEVCRALSVSRTMVYKLIHQKILPPPCHFGRSSRWRWRDVRRLADRMRGRLGRSNNPYGARGRGAG